MIDDSTLLLGDAGLVRNAAGALELDGVDVSEIAGAVGTPAYVYNAGVIRRQYARLDAAFSGLPHRIHFAIKSNGNLAILALLRQLGAGADIVSVGELRRALAAGFAPESIVFSGVGKSADEIEAAVAAHVGSINVESAEELETIIAVVERRPVPRQVRIGIRVNPDVTADTHPYISTGKSGIKFGVPNDRVEEVARRVAGHPRLVLTTLAMHLGSQLLAVAPFEEGLTKLVALWDGLVADGLTTIDQLDIGGGLGIRYRDETPLAPEALAGVVGRVLGGRRLRVNLEPGRFLVGSAGILLTRVLYRKRSGGKTFVIVDAGMNDLVRPSHYQAHHEIVEVMTHGRPAEPVDVVGPVCETGDFLALERTLHAAHPGELLAVLCAGAYGFVMSSTYNARPRPVEVLVDGGRFAVARPREALDDLARGERITPFAS